MHLVFFSITAGIAVKYFAQIAPLKGPQCPTSKILNEFVMAVMVSLFIQCLNHSSVRNSIIFLKILHLISAEIQQSKWHLGNPISGGRGRQQSMDQASSGLTGSLPNDVAVRRTTSSNLWDEEVHWTPNNAEKSDSSKRWLIFSVKLIIHRIVTCSRPICMPPCAFLLQFLPFCVDFSSPYTLFCQTIVSIGVRSY